MKANTRRGRERERKKERARERTKVLGVYFLFRMQKKVNLIVKVFILLRKLYFDKYILLKIDFRPLISKKYATKGEISRTSI